MPLVRATCNLKIKLIVSAILIVFVDVPGTFGPIAGLTVCTNCSSGFACPNSNASVGTSCDPGMLLPLRLFPFAEVENIVFPFTILPQADTLVLLVLASVALRLLDFFVPARPAISHCFALQVPFAFSVLHRLLLATLGLITPWLVNRASKRVWPVPWEIFAPISD